MQSSKISIHNTFSSQSGQCCHLVGIFAVSISFPKTHHFKWRIWTLEERHFSIFNQYLFSIELDTFRKHMQSSKMPILIILFSFEAEQCCHPVGNFAISIFFPKAQFFKLSVWTRKDTFLYQYLFIVVLHTFRKNTQTSKIPIRLMFSSQAVQCCHLVGNFAICNLLSKGPIFKMEHLDQEIHLAIFLL